LAESPVENADVKTIREQIELLSLAEGFFSSSVLFTLQKLKIFQLLGEESKSVEELAARLGCQVSPLQRLLNAGVMLKLLRAEGQVYRLTEAARAVLLPTSRGGYLGDWIELMEQFSLAYNRLDQAVLRNGPSIDPEEYLGGDPSHTRKYIYAMHNYAAVRGKELSRYIDGKHLNSLLDLGCGPGTFAYHLAAGNPQMRLTLADLPGVLEVTREIALGYQLPNEMEFLSLDASRDDLPGSYDLVLASNMLQCFDDRERSDLLRRIYRAVRPGGSIVVQAQHLQPHRQGGRWAVLVDLNLLCTTHHGRNHTLEDSARWLLDAGFIDLEKNAMSVFGTTSFVRGYRPC
jgi:SAM-dependent methyltransferase